MNYLLIDNGEPDGVTSFLRLIGNSMEVRDVIEWAANVRYLIAQIGIHSIQSLMMDLESINRRFNKTSFPPLDERTLATLRRYSTTQAINAMPESERHRYHRVHDTLYIEPVDEEQSTSDKDEDEDWYVEPDFCF